MPNSRTNQKLSRVGTLVPIIAMGLLLAGCDDVQAAPDVPSTRAELVMLWDGSTMAA